MRIVKFIAVLAILLFGEFSLGQMECPEKSKNFGRVAVAKKQTLFACGVETGKTVNDLTISLAADDKLTVVFSSDDAFKTYRIHRDEKAFYLEEGLNLLGGFRPLIEMKVSCSKEKCDVADTKCLFKKVANTNRDKSVAALIKSRKCINIGSRVDEIFESALSGYKPAIQFFSKPSNVGCSAEGSESLMTYKNDVERLLRLGCL